MKRFSTLSLRMRLVLLVLLGAIPALGFLLYTGWTQRQLASSLMQANAIRVVRLAALEQTQLVDGTRHLLMVLAQLPEIRNRHIPSGQTILNKVFNDHLPVYANIGMIDLGGQVIFSVVPAQKALNLKDRAYFQQTIETQAFSIGGYQIGRITQKPTINFGYPVYDTQGRLSGVLFAAVDVGWLSQMIADAQLPPKTEAYVLEDSGTILARYPADDRVIGTRLPMTEISRAVKAQDEGTLETRGTDGVHRLYAFTDLGRHHQLGSIRVVIGIPSRLAYAEVNRTMVHSLLGLALAAMLALLAAWYGGEFFILSRVRPLLAATRRLATGDLGARTGLDYKAGEFGELSRSFDEMAAALQIRAAQRDRAEGELKALNEVLEQRVEARTQELLERTRQMEADLEMARDLQQAFLPHQPPGALRITCTGGGALQFYHRYHPTGKVGGDFFDVLSLSNSRAGVFICDVMGQGLRAALVTAIVRGLVEELKPIADRAGDFLTQINRGLSAVFNQTGTPMFASAFYLIADAENGRMEYANAGHPSPMLVSQENCAVQELRCGGTLREPALGLIPDFVYPAYTTPLQNGDLIILYTDGLFEVEGATEEFGPERLVDAVHRRIMLPPMLLFDGVLEEIQGFSATHEFSDDVCLVGMQVSRRPSGNGHK